jgi:cytoskeletal protein CcmA (bactofilin family)
MSEPVTIIGEHMRVAGKLTGSEDLSVFGNVEGSIELTESLLVESTGVVKAEVKVRNAIISGIVVGNIVAQEMVEITSKGRMIGDISAPRVILTDGAAFRGRIAMTGVGSDDADVADARASRAPRDRAATPTRAPVPPSVPTPVRTATPTRTVAPPRPVPRAADEPRRPIARPVAPSGASPSPTVHRSTETGTATATVTEVAVDPATDPVEAVAHEPGADLLSVDEFRELGWNKCRSYIKSRDIDLEYSGFDELVDAYALHLAQQA